MSKNMRSQEDAVKKFWDRYIGLLAKKGVSPKVLSWYVIHAEMYIKAISGKRLAEHGPEDVKSYLEQQAINQEVEDWQSRQIVDAIQNLFELLAVPWLQEIDWQHWLDGSCLPARHSTIAREDSARKTIERLSRLSHSQLAETR